MRYNSFLLFILLSFLFFTSACEFLNRPPDREISHEERLWRASEQGKNHEGMSPYSQPGTQLAPTGGSPGSQPGAYQGDYTSHGPPSNIYQTLPIDTGGPPVRKEPVCNTNSDCVLVNVGCCGCASGGEAIAVHKLQKDAHNKALSARCGNPAERMCTGWYRCSSYEVQCQNSQCVAVTSSGRR